MSKTISVMTYNDDSCIGMVDGKVSPSRPARVIGRCNPDVDDKPLLATLELP